MANYRLDPKPPLFFQVGMILALVMGISWLPILLVFMRLSGIPRLTQLGLAAAGAGTAVLSLGLGYWLWRYMRARPGYSLDVDGDGVRLHRAGKREKFLPLAEMIEMIARAENMGLQLRARRQGESIWIPPGLVNLAAFREQLRQMGVPERSIRAQRRALATGVLIAVTLAIISAMRHPPGAPPLWARLLLGAIPGVLGLGVVMWILHRSRDQYRDNL